MGARYPAAAATSRPPRGYAISDAIVVFPAVVRFISFEKELAAVEGGTAPASGEATPAAGGSDDEGAGGDAPPAEGDVSCLQ